METQIDWNILTVLLLLCRILNNCHDDASKFICLLAKPNCNYLEQEDFIPVLQVCLTNPLNSSLELPNNKNSLIIEPVTEIAPHHQMNSTETRISYTFVTDSAHWDSCIEQRIVFDRTLPMPRFYDSVVWQKE